MGVPPRDSKCLTGIDPVRELRSDEMESSHHYNLENYLKLKPSEVKNPTHFAGPRILSEEIYFSKVILKYSNYVKKKRQLFPGRGKTMAQLNALYQTKRAPYMITTMTKRQTPN